MRPKEPLEPSFHFLEDSEAAQAFLDRAIAAARETPRINYGFAIVERATSLLIGDAWIGIVSFPNMRAEIGYTLRRDR